MGLTITPSLRAYPKNAGSLGNHYWRPRNPRPDFRHGNYLDSRVATTVSSVSISLRHWSIWDRLAFPRFLDSVLIAARFISMAVVSASTTIAISSASSRTLKDLLPVT